MDALDETEVTGRERRSNEFLAPVEHWAYQVDSPFRPVHEILEAAEGRSGTVPALVDEAAWRDTNLGQLPVATGYEPPMADTLETMTRPALEADGEELEELEDLEEEDEDPEAENEGEDESLELQESDLGDEEDEEEDLDEDEDFEDESTELEESELANLPTADEGREREADDVSEFEDELEDQELEDELMSRSRHRRRTGARQTRPRTRRIIVRRGDTLVIKWR